MDQPTLAELERAADEVLSKAKKSEKLDPDEITDDAEEVEEDGAEAEEDEEESADEEEADGGDDDEDDEDEEDDVKKSLMNEVLDGDDAVSETMTALVEIFAKSLADVMENVTDSKEHSENSSEILAKSLLAQNVILNDQKQELEKNNRALRRMNKSLAEKLDEINDKLDDLGTQPAHMRKSVASYSVTDRNFRGSREGTDGGGTEKLTKAQMVGILSNELMSGSGVVTPEDIIAVESGGTIRGEIRALIDSKSR